MLKRLFVSIGRKKRIDRKMKYLNQLIGQLNGRMKIDFALKVAESVAVAKNSRTLEEIADFYIIQIKKALE